MYVLFLFTHWMILPGTTRAISVRVTSERMIVTRE